MELTGRQWQLFDFVKQMHGDQKRRYSGEPYYIHLLSVADKVSQYESGFHEMEIALCHDLVEDTPCSLADLSDQLIRLGYDVNQDAKILNGVADLTDVYTHDKYPTLNRSQRKELEAMRVIQSKPFSQTVKYADILDNLNSILLHDKGFARIYLNEVNRYIWKIDKGNPQLYKECCQAVDDAFAKLEMQNVN
ncbi:metal-dependent phosphohydrolase [Dyadobacter bucti]|uniref:metal-dependent phosphohydrolase n=1 Tax=Dyadobacter bucti TaxID=2572203 RepID=UPI003F72C7F7